MEKGERLSVLKQDHFAYEEHTVIDTVIMRKCKSFIKLCKIKMKSYMLKPDFSEEDGIKVAAKLEAKICRARWMEWLNLMLHSFIKWI